MAENAIEILIDVATQEGIASLDDFTKVLSDTAGKVGAVSDSIDELDGALSGIAKSGASAQDMAVRMVSTLEDFGIEVKDADGLVAALAGTLTKLGASGKEAADGVGLATDANKLLTDSSKLATDQIVRQGGALKLVATEAITTGDAIASAEARAAIGATEAAAAIETMGAGYVKVATTAELATPALMKAATWAGIGLAGLAYEGIKQYSAFNKLITQTITQAGEAPSKMGFLSGLAESVAKSTGQGLDDVANTIYRAASGTAAWNDGLGATKKQLADIVTNVSKLNVVGGIASGAESEQASRVVTALINSNIRGVGRSSLQAAALVNAVVGSGDMRLADLVPGIGRGLLSSAVANNLSAKDALAWVATLTSQGTTASVAGNYVKTGVNLLAHPSAQGVEALSMLGIKPGELENLMSGPGGLVSALSTLKTGMKQLNPSSMAKYFFHEAGAVYPGGSGLQGAVAKLQTWSAGELSPTFIKNWEANKLTPQEQTQATDLILTKAFGGSKQFATIAAVINNLGLVKGIEAHIGSEDTAAYFKAQYARTEATPSQQFKRMGQNLLVDLVNAGKTLTPLALTFGHAMTAVIDGLSKFKGVLIGFATLAMGLLGAAAIGKGAQLLSHLAPIIGAAQNRLGSMVGKDSAFTSGMIERQSDSRFKFLNIYKAKRHGVLGKLGGEAISSGQLPATDAELAGGAEVEGLSKGDNALLSAQARANGFLGEIAANTRVSDAEGSGGGARFGGKGGAEEAAANDYKYTEGTTMPPLGPRAADNGAYDYVIGSRGGPRSAVENDGSMYFNPKTGRMHDSATNKMLSGDEIEARSVYPAGNPIPLGAASSEVESGAPIALGMGEAAAPVAETLGGDAAAGGLGEMLGGLAGGPVGMMGMMMAPMLIAGLSPLIGKLGGLFGDWFGGGAPKPFHAHIKGAAVDTVQASAKLAKDLKDLHQYDTEIKNKSGKEEWVRSQAAYLADPIGYYKALRKYQLASHTYTGSIRNANAISSQAISALYGSESNRLNNDLAAAQRLSGHDVPFARGLAGVGTAAQMRALIMRLPGTATKGLQGAEMKMVAKYGINWQDFSKLISKDKSLARGVFADTEGSSLQTLKKHDPLAYALTQGGYFQAGSALSLNTKEMNRALSEKGATAAKAAQFLPAYANQYHRQVLADIKALKTPLPPEAKTYFENQKKSAQDSLDKTDKLIEAMRKVADDTKLDGESVSKLAKENAQAIAASGLTADQIGAAVAAAIKSQLKTSRVVGSGGPVTGSKPPSIFSPAGGSS